MWYKSNKKNLGYILMVVATVLIVVTTYLIVSDTPLLSPLSTDSTFQFLPSTLQKNHDKRVVYGFLPYWNINKVDIKPELTHLGYFGLTIGSNGKLQTIVDGANEPGFNKLKSDEFFQIAEDVKKNNGKIELVLVQFENDDIVEFLNSDNAHQNLFQSLDSILLAYPIEGINIDIEYSGEVTPHLQQKMSDFVVALDEHVHQKYQGVTLSIDMYSSAASNELIWDVAKIGEHVDYIIIMAYDFHRRSSPVAGPVAPLFGGKTLWDSDISDHLQDFLKQVPKEKLLLGVPFYGYEWQTTSNDSQATTIPDTGSTATYDRVQKILSNKKELRVETHWNEEALSPYVSYVEDGNTYIMYYDDSRSLSYKLDFVNQLDLGGIAIWALGYEGEYNELWDVIFRKLKDS